jgi:signal transduction histidine kinase
MRVSPLQRLDGLGELPSFSPSEVTRNKLINRLQMVAFVVSLFSTLAQSPVLPVHGILVTLSFAFVIAIGFGFIAAKRTYFGRFFCMNGCTVVCFYAALYFRPLEFEPILLISTALYGPLYFSPRKQKFYFYFSILFAFGSYLLLQMLLVHNGLSYPGASTSTVLGSFLAVVSSFGLFSFAAGFLVRALAKEDDKLRLEKRKLLASQRLCMAVGFEWDTHTGEILWGEEFAHVFGSEINPPRNRDELKRGMSETEIEELQVFLERLTLFSEPRLTQVCWNERPHPPRWYAVVLDSPGCEPQIRTLYGVVREVTEQVKAQKLLEEQRMTLLQNARMAALGEMAAGIAHEINNPLTIIHGQAHMLELLAEKKKILTLEEIKDCTKKISQTVHRVSRIVVTMRSLARETTGPSVDSVSLKDVIQEVIELCQERFSFHKVELTLELDDRFPGVACVASHVSQVLLNLIGNALDAVLEHRHKGERNKPWVKVTLRLENGTQGLFVTNGGPKPTKEVQSKLFQPFFTTKEVGKGVGLGLSISRSLAERNGALLVYLPEEPNTTFSLLFPMS